MSIWTKQIGTANPQRTIEVPMRGWTAKVTVWRTTPGVWSVEVNGTPSEQHFSTVHEAQRYALRWLSAMDAEQALPVVTLDWYLGDRNVRFLAATGDRTQALWNEVLAKREERAAAEQAQAAPVEAAAPTRGQEYKGVVITVRRVPDGDNHGWFYAEAGGRSRITRACNSEAQARAEAISAIDNAIACNSANCGLWINDTVHWRASQDHTLPAEEMLRRCRADGMERAMLPLPKHAHDDLHREMLELLKEARTALNWQGAEYLAKRIANCIAKVEG